MKNAKTGLKIISGFGIVIVINCVIIISLLVNMGRIAKMTQQIYENSYIPNDLMWSVTSNLNGLQKSLYKIVSITDPVEMDKTNAEITKYITEMQNSVKQLQNILETPEKKALIDEINNKIIEATPIRERIAELGKLNKNEEGVELITSKYEPIVNQATEAIHELSIIVSNDATNFVNSSKKASNVSICIGIGLLIAGVIIAVIISGVITNSIIIPIKQITAAANEMSKGHLNARKKITYKSKDEIGQLSESLLITMNTLSMYIEEISSLLHRISLGDLTQKEDDITNYLGDFESIKLSLVRILKNFNTTLGEINQSSSQVASSSSQVSNAAQELSQGSTEQASSIEELALTIGSISEQVKSNANHALEANKMSDSLSGEIIESNKQMQGLIGAMNEIKTSSHEISKIIKTIEDIAFQTNILALNAAVEAARAGNAGKGFAVVADEVRNLASKSAEAAKNTTSLIEGSVKAVENGTNIADEAANSLLIVVESAKKVSSDIDRITEASNTQAQSINKITQNIDQISLVVQTNSATSQQSAAASEELSEQAKILNTLVARFKLHDMPVNDSLYYNS